MKIERPSPQRARSRCIQPIPVDALWVRVRIAATQSGISEKILRRHFRLRRFGNADFLNPEELNRWILNGELPTANGDTHDLAR